MSKRVLAGEQPTEEEVTIIAVKKVARVDQASDAHVVQVLQRQKPVDPSVLTEALKRIAGAGSTEASSESSQTSSQGAKSPCNGGKVLVKVKSATSKSNNTGSIQDKAGQVTIQKEKDETKSAEGAASNVAENPESDDEIEVFMTEETILYYERKKYERQQAIDDKQRNMIKHLQLLDKVRLDEEEIEKLPETTQSVLRLADCIFGTVKLKSNLHTSKEAFNLAASIIHVSKIMSFKLIHSEFNPKIHEVTHVHLAYTTFTLARIKKQTLTAVHFEQVEHLLRYYKQDSHPRQILKVMMDKFSKKKLYSTKRNADKEQWYRADEFFESLFDEDDYETQWQCTLFLVVLFGNVEDGHLTL